MEAIFDSCRRRHLALFMINFMDKKKTTRVKSISLYPYRRAFTHTLILISTALCFSIITSSEFFFLSLIQHATMAIIKREVKEGRVKLSHAHFY